jgi:hypothetical protein
MFAKFEGLSLTLHRSLQNISESCRPLQSEPRWQHCDPRRVELAARYHLPSIYASRAAAADGGLMSWR